MPRGVLVGPVDIRVLVVHLGDVPEHPTQARSTFNDPHTPAHLFPPHEEAIPGPCVEQLEPIDPVQRVGRADVEMEVGLLGLNLRGQSTATSAIGT